MRGMNRVSTIAFVLLISLGFPASSGAVQFAPPKTYPVGTSPSAVVVADFNGDGKPDLAVANSGSNNVSILLGNGDGTFQPAVNFDAGLSPSSIAVGDFNGDGKPDLAVFLPGDPANSVAGVVGILLGNGNGTFQAAKSLTLTALSSQIAVADFNSDKNADLAVSNVDRSTNDVTVSIFLGKGDGTFQSARIFSMPPGANGALAVADFNNDTKPDFAIGGSGGIPIFLGNGDGTFALGPAAPTVDTGTVQSIQAGDVNGDGKADLVISSFRSFLFSSHSSTTQNVSIFLGNGDGTFQSEHILASASSFRALFVTGTGIAEVTVGDFNGDGKVDVAYRRPTFQALSPASVVLEILLGRGDGSFSSALVLNDPGRAVVSGKLNADSLSDLLALGPGDQVSVILNTSPTSGADLGIIQPGASPNPAGVGTNLTYTADVLNEGPKNATGVTFSDTLPDGVNFVSATATQGSCIQSHGVVTCSIGSLASAFDSQVTILVTPTAPGTITNSMNVTATEPDLASANNTAVQSSNVLPVYTLTVSIAGSGSGSVISNDGVINCASSGGPCSSLYLLGTSVSLRAAPAGTSVFGGWSGACAGTDPNVCSVTLNANQSVTAAFNPPPDFSVTPAATSLTMKRGGQVSEVLTFGAQGGFSGSIALACSVSGPSPMPTCGISPASVTPGTNATLTVNAAALSASPTAPWFGRGARLYAAWLPLGLLGCCVLATSFDKKRRRMWLLCLLVMAAILPAACGGGSSASAPPPPPAQTFTVTVTATSGTLQHFTNITVTVQ